MKPTTDLEKQAVFALAKMVEEYMDDDGIIRHEFLSAQENAIDVLESVGWLVQAEEIETYRWNVKLGIDWDSTTVGAITPTGQSYGERLTDLESRTKKLERELLSAFPSIFRPFVRFSVWLAFHTKLNRARKKSNPTFAQIKNLIGQLKREVES